MLKITPLNYQEIDYDKINVGEKIIVGYFPFENEPEFDQLIWINGELFRWYRLGTCDTFIDEKASTEEEAIKNILKVDCPYGPTGSKIYVMIFDNIKEYGEWLITL